MKIISCISAALFGAAYGMSPQVEDDELTSLSNSCVGKEDGDYWLQLSVTKEEYMPVKLRCSAEYVILDIAKDNTLQDYFSTFEKWHYAAAGPSNNDMVTWREWFTPSNEDYTIKMGDSQFLISPDCQSCEPDAIRQVAGTDTSYYMSGNIYKANYMYTGFVDCDMDPETYQCYDCSENNINSGETIVLEYSEDTPVDYYSESGACPFLVQEAKNFDVPRSRFKAQFFDTVNEKPSIGLDGKFCTCYQPSIHYTKTFELSNDQINYIKEREDSGEEPENEMLVLTSSKIDGRTTGAIIEDERDTNIVYLSQKDFMDGTYRIRKSGTYVITEDITFNFGEDDDWWPTAEQNTADEYPGAAQYREPYSFGFFAGLTVETDYVTIDLNQHELKMSMEFYMAQRWFSIIELSNQMFLPGQGPGYFGSDAINTNYATIKNGVMGLTSHFAVHGNFASNLVIENVHIKDFATHGIQLNGHSDLNINNVEIGPSSTVEYLRPEFAHCRLYLMRLRDLENDMMDEYGEDYIQHTVAFDGGRYGKAESTITDIADELELQMEMAYQYAVNRATNNNEYIDSDYIDPKYTEDEDGQYRWELAKKTFVKENGIPSASGIVGIFLNYRGASVLHYAKYTTLRSDNAVLENIYIHDIKHDMVETIRIEESGGFIVFITPWRSEFPWEGALQYDDDLMADIFQRTKDGIDAYAEDPNTSSGEIEPDYTGITYRGTALTDAFVALGKFSDDWNYLGFYLVNDEGDDSMDDSIFMQWVTGDHAYRNKWRFACNSDLMGHSGKGILGIRIDGTSQLTMRNIRMENFHEMSPLGNENCGDYDGTKYSYYNGAFLGDGHIRQLTPMQTGFSGNNLHGITVVSSDNVYFDGYIEIKNMETWYGDASGIALWTANDITFKQDAFIKVHGLYAGTKLEEGQYDYDSLPNRNSESCAVRLEDTTSIYESYVTFENEDAGNSNIFACNIQSPEYCMGDDSYGQTMYGKYIDDDASKCTSIDDLDEMRTTYADISGSDGHKNQGGAGAMNVVNSNVNDSSIANNLGLFVLCGVFGFIAALVYVMRGSLLSNNKTKSTSTSNYGSIAGQQTVF